MINVQRIDKIPSDFEELGRVASEEGHPFVRRMSQSWEEGENRFDRAGEALFEARYDGLLVGICGLNQDPYQDDPEVGRVRHLYVLPSHRRVGVGRLLMEAIIAHANRSFSTLRLRTKTDEGDRFYRAIGFGRVDDDGDATHRYAKFSERSSDESI